MTHMLWLQVIGSNKSTSRRTMRLLMQKGVICVAVLAPFVPSQRLAQYLPVYNPAP